MSFGHDGALTLVNMESREILLNGKPVFLRGICIHEEFPLNDGGCVNPAAKARQLLPWAKELGCKFERLAHYRVREQQNPIAQ